MKNLILMLMLLLAAVALTACGGRAVETREAQATRTVAATEAPKPAAKAAPAAATARPAKEDRPVDLDLTKISGTVVYSQVFDMMSQPEAYMGKTVRVKGTFGYYQDPVTKKEYFATVIADATACCSQGIEFVWRGKHTFPRDYPPLDTEITVTGIFDAYTEDDYTYIQLTDAELEWRK